MPTRPRSFAGIRRPLPSPRKQRGAAALFVAITLVALMTAVGFALDLGRLYTARAELDKLASVAALSSIRQVSGCRTGAAAPADDVDAYVASMLLQNGLAEADLDNLTSLIEPGILVGDGVSRLLDSSVEAEMADAVSVTLTQPLPPPLFPLLPQQEGAVMRAQAQAAQTVVGRVAVGTSLLSINSDESLLLNGLLGGLLGGAVNLTVLDYGNLLAANITLLDLVEAAPGVGSVEDLLNLSTSLPGFLGIVSDALYATGEGIEAAAAGILDTLAALAAPPVGAISAGDFIGVEEGLQEQVGELPINVLDLLLGLSQLANEGYAVAFSVPNLAGISIPGIASITINADVKLGEAPQEAFGRPGYNSSSLALTRAYSSQLQVLLDIDVSLLPIGTFALLNMNLGVAVEGANGTADLAMIRCPTPSAPETTIWVDGASTVARMAVGDFNPADPDPIDNPGRLVVLEVLGLDLLVVDPVVEVNVGTSSAGIIQYDGPFVPDIDEPAPEHTTSLGTDTGTLLSGAVSGLLSQLVPNIVANTPVLGLVLAPILTPVINLAMSLLDPILNAVGSAVLTPLLNLLGADVGAAEITLKAATVTQPYLIYTE